MYRLAQIIGIPNTSDEGVEIEISSKEDCIKEICELRKAIKSIHSDLIKFKGMKAYEGNGLLSNFETKYIEDAIGICENHLDVHYSTV